MNKKTGYVLRIVLGCYLAYLGVKIANQMIRSKPTNMAVMCVSAVIFFAVGAGYAIYCLKKLFDIRKQEMGESGDSEEDENRNRNLRTSRTSGGIDLKRTVLSQSTDHMAEGSESEKKGNSGETASGKQEEKTKPEPAEPKETVYRDLSGDMNGDLLEKEAEKSEEETLLETVKEEKEEIESDYEEK